jgi:hypothetical protein
MIYMINLRREGKNQAMHEYVPFTLSKGSSCIMSFIPIVHGRKVPFKHSYSWPVLQGNVALFNPVLGAGKEHSNSVSIYLKFVWFSVIHLMGLTIRGKK